MEYYDGIQYPEGHDTFCHCDLCEATERAIVEHHRRLRAARIKAEAEEIEEQMIRTHIERNYR